MGNTTFPPLDESLYSLDDEQSSFLKTLTGIQDDEELKRHIINVQTKAYQVFTYPCIKRFIFTELKISRLSVYSQIVELRKERENSILLDIGCCFGNDVRKAGFDGWPIENIIASDIRPEFWEYGHELFKSTPETFPAKFIAGDAFDAAMIYPNDPFYDTAPFPIPDISTLTSLTPLQGHVSAIHASALFHLFDFDKQLELARQIATLLSPIAGSIIFGSHMGREVKGLRAEKINNQSMSCHSPESWKELWDGVVFKKKSVRVKAILKEIDRPEFPQSPEKYYLMDWSVTRM